MTEVYQDRLFEVNKRCKKCGAVKAVDAFHQRNGKPISPCKECKRRYMKWWNAQNPERVAEYKRRWTRENPEYKPQWQTDNAEYLREKRARYYQKNRDVILPKRREYARRTRDQAVERKRKWRHANPEKHRIQVSRRRALKQQATGSCDAETLEEMYDSQQGLCAYCERDLEGEFNVEHMTPLSRGGSNDWTNIALACANCNARKWTRTAEEFMQLERALDHAVIAETGKPC